MLPGGCADCQRLKLGWTPEASHASSEAQHPQSRGLAAGAKPALLRSPPPAHTDWLLAEARLREGENLLEEPRS